MKNFGAIIILILALLVAGCHHEHSEDGHHAEAGEKVADPHDHGHEAIDGPRPEKLELPEHLANVLRKEMVEITSGMGTLLAHISQGNGVGAAAIATKIQNSFILKQELSPQDLKQLVSLLPEAFVTMDRTFHANAGKVATMADKKDFAGAMKLYGQMAQACVDCHGQYAADRFPEMAVQR